MPEQSPESSNNDVETLRGDSTLEPENVSDISSQEDKELEPMFHVAPDQDMPIPSDSEPESQNAPRNTEAAPLNDSSIELVAIVPEQEIGDPLVPLLQSTPLPENQHAFRFPEDNNNEALPAENAKDTEENAAEETLMVSDTSF